MTHLATNVLCYGDNLNILGLIVDRPPVAGLR